jgi:hypothetical protein
LLAERLQRLFPKSKNFSVLVPASRQERGIDLALVHTSPGGSSRVALLQVKASRTYSPEPPKRQTTHHFRFYTWFNTFKPSDHADFFLLMGMYAPDSAQTKRVGSRWYRDVTLLLTYVEMKKFIDNCRTVGDQPDGKFGFGFNDERQIFQTRGDSLRKYTDFTDCLLDKRFEMLKTHLAA